MEVYQSSKTAAEMEYALGAVPSIGANGNWFIGEQDTGIFAAGVDVTGAEVGQIIKVAEVDENGRPTAWTSEDAIGGWTLLGSADSLESDVYEIVIETDVNGNAFSVDELFIYGVFATTGSTATSLKMAINGASKKIDFPSCAVQTTLTGRGVYIDIPKKGGMLRPTWALHVGGATTNVISNIINKTSHAFDIDVHLNVYRVDKISKISFTLGDSNAFNTAVCYRVYGR